MKRLNRMLISFAAALFLLAGCAHEKYPYTVQYVSTVEVPPTVLAPPPPQNSPEFVKGINTVLARQKHLTFNAIKVLKSEENVAPEMLVTTILGASVTPLHYPDLYEHLKRLGSDSWRIGDVTKDYWQSPRPWIADTRVHLYVGPIHSYGYPSGHTTTNVVWALVLGDLFPCKKAALIARANAIGYHRIEAGAHFPFDIEGGKHLGQAIYDQLRTSQSYLNDHETLRQEVKKLPNVCAAAKI